MIRDGDELEASLLGHHRLAAELNRAVLFTG